VKEFFPEAEVYEVKIDNSGYNVVANKIKI
jgi:hypothetical protein